MKTSCTLEWTKVAYTTTVTYTTGCGRFKILRTRNRGEWSLYALYVDGVWFRGYATLAEAKEAAATIAS